MSFTTDFYKSHFESQARQNELQGKSGTEERMVVKMLERNTAGRTSTAQPLPHQPYQYPPYPQSNQPKRYSTLEEVRANEAKRAAKPAKKAPSVIEVIGGILGWMLAAFIVYCFVIA